MSSLLERMIQRTREPLSAVEPLLPPRYARSEAQRSQTDAEAEANELASKLSSAEYGPASRRAAENPPPQSVDLPGEMQPAVSTATPIAYREHGPSSANMTNPINLPGYKAPGIQEAQVAKAAPQHATPGPRTGGPAPSSISNAEPNLEAGSEGVAFRRIERRATIPDAIVPSAMPVEHVRVAADKVAPGRPTTIRQLRLAPEHEVRADNETSDINITIGHIDVRVAQQSVERTRKPAFRPRVSLSDFLGRRSGERP